MGDNTLELLQAEIDLFGNDDEVAVGVLRQAKARIEALETALKKAEALNSKQSVRAIFCLNCGAHIEQEPHYADCPFAVISQE